MIIRCDWDAIRRRRRTASGANRCVCGFPVALNLNNAEVNERVSFVLLRLFLRGEDVQRRGRRERLGAMRRLAPPLHDPLPGAEGHDRLRRPSGDVPKGRRYALSPAQPTAPGGRRPPQLQPETADVAGRGRNRPDHGRIWVE